MPPIARLNCVSVTRRRPLLRDAQIFGEDVTSSGRPSYCISNTVIPMIPKKKVCERITLDHLQLKYQLLAYRSNQRHPSTLAVSAASISISLARPPPILGAVASSLRTARTVGTTQKTARFIPSASKIATRFHALSNTEPSLHVRNSESP